MTNKPSNHKDGNGDENDLLFDEAPTKPFVRHIEDSDDHVRIIDVRALRAAIGIDLGAKPDTQVRTVPKDVRPNLKAMLTHESLHELPAEIQSRLKPGAKIELIPLSLNGEVRADKSIRYGTIIPSDSFPASLLKGRYNTTTFLPQVGQVFGFAALNGTLDIISPVQQIYVYEGAIFLVTKSARNTSETIYKLVINKTQSTVIPPSLVNNSLTQRSDVEMHPAGFHDIRPIREAFRLIDKMRKIFKPGTSVLLSKILHEGEPVNTSEHRDEQGLVPSAGHEAMKADSSLSDIPVVGRKFFFISKNGGVIQTGELAKVNEEDDNFVLTTVNGSEYLLTKLS